MIRYRLPAVNGHRPGGERETAAPDGLLADGNAVRAAMVDRPERNAALGVALGSLLSAGAGNATVARFLQRAGGTGPQPGNDGAAVAQAPGGGSAGGRPAPQQEPGFGPALQLPADQARTLINECYDAVGSLATSASRWPDAPDAAIPDTPAVLAADQAPDGSVDTLAAGLRPVHLMTPAAPASGADGPATINVEAGVVGSVQVSCDLCTGEVELGGWLWAGIGSRLPGWGWVGSYYYYDAPKWGVWQRPELKLIEPGECAGCGTADSGGHAGRGGGVFPIHKEPGTMKRLGAAGIEIGVLVSPDPDGCGAELEGILLVNCLEYLPGGKALTTFIDGINAVTKRHGVDFLVEAGGQVNIGAHVCRAARPRGGFLGDWTADHLKVGGGLFIGGGVGLSHNKNELPHPAPARSAPARPALQPAH